MKILLDRNDFSFSKMSGPFGDYRALLVKVNGKPFFTSRRMEDWREMDSNYAEYADKALIESMERMLTKVFEEACAAAPEGVDLLLDKEPTKAIMRDVFK